MHQKNLLSIIGICVVILLAGLFFLLQKNLDSTQQNKEVVSDSVQQIIPLQAVRADDSLRNFSFVYAVNEDNKTRVMQKSFSDDKGSTLFEYADAVGEYYVPPFISASPDGTHVAYIDTKGLHIRTLATGATISPIKKISERSFSEEGSDMPPVWSLSDLNGRKVFALSNPRWSPDGTHLAITENYIEGGGVGIFEVTTGVYYPPSVAGYIDESSWHWASRGLLYSIPLEGPDGLHISRPGSLGSTFLLPTSTGKERALYYDARISPDETTIAIIYIPKEGDWLKKEIALVKKDGSAFKVIASQKNFLLPFFSSDGSQLYFFENTGGQFDPPHLTLIRYNIDTEAREEIVAFPEGVDISPDVSITKEGLVWLDITSSLDSSRQFILFDVNKKKVLYAMERLPASATFLSYSSN